MGKQSNLKLAANAANLIFYERLGGHYIRSKPTDVKQTAATRASAGKFGTAIRLCKATREALAHLLPGNNKKPLMLRLNNAFYKWLLDNPATGHHTLQYINSLHGFELNEESSFAQLLKIKLQTNWQVPGQVQLLLPSFNPSEAMTAPGGTDTTMLTVTLVSMDIPTATVTTVDSAQLLIDNKVMSLLPKVLTLPYIREEQQVYVLAVALHYYRTALPAPVLCKEVRWLPVMITEAVY